MPLPHAIKAPADDLELLRVYDWLMDRPIADLLRQAVDESIKYVLDGARTWRFDLNDPEVDSDERSSVGTKLQYHVIQKLGLKKMPPLDTVVDDLPVEIKGTVNRTWMIPREGQCQISLLVRINAKANSFAVWLMRTHRAWLNEGGNQDKKRTPKAEAVGRYALEVVPWDSLPDDPLRLLTSEQLGVVFDRSSGMRRRAASLFEFVPRTIVPRSTLEVVGAGLKDPLKRAREARVDLRAKGIILVVGTWLEERRSAYQLGVDLDEDEWCAFPESDFTSANIPVPSLR